MNVVCNQDVCPIILNSRCIFYEGDNLVYTGIVTNDNLQIALQKIDAAFAGSGVGYVFQNGVTNIGSNVVEFGGSLLHNTVISGNYFLQFLGTLGASAFITAGGNSSQFVKGDGSLDGTSYQPAGSYISQLTGDGTAIGPGSSILTLSTVNSNPGTYGDNSNIPIVTVNGKGLVTNITTTPISIPSGSLSFVGDVTGSGTTGSPVTLTLQTVNTNTYGSDTFLKFSVNGKGLVTSASLVTSLDIDSILGYTPVPPSRTLTINGVSFDLSTDRSWTIDNLPSQTGNAGKWLTTNGTIASWATLSGNISLFTNDVGYITASSSDNLTNKTGNISQWTNDVGYVTISSFSANAPITYNSGVISTSMNTNKLIGRSSASIGVMEEISIGSGLSLSLGTLSATGSGGTVTNFTSGNLSPLFTTSVATSTTTPALTFSLSTSGANTWFGNNTGGSTTPSFNSAGSLSETTSSVLTITGTNTLLSNTTIQVKQASGSQSGYLSSTDWTTFDSKQASLTGSQGDIIYFSATNTISNLAKNTSATRYLSNTGASNNPQWDQINLNNGVTNILGLSNGGTNANLSATGGTGQYLKQVSSGASITVGTIPASDIVSGQAFTKTDDTNVTATLGGTPGSAVLVPMSFTLGWTGALAYSRFVNGSGLSVVGRSANTSGVQADIIGTNNQILRVSGTTLGFGSIDLSQSASVGVSVLGVANGGTGASSFTNGSVIFQNTVLSQDNNNFYWNVGSHILSVNTAGDQTGTDSINAYNQIDAYLPQSSQGTITNTGATSGFTASSSAGTGASPSNLSAGNLVGGFSMWGYTNSTYTNVAGAFAYVTGSTSTNLGGEYRIYTKMNGGALTQRFTIDNAGGLQIVSATSSNTWTNAFTASANNQYGITATNTITSRSTTSDFVGGYDFNSILTANGTTITLDGFTCDYTPIVIGGVSTLANGGASASMGSTLAGMTATSYTSIAPASTSGSGTGATFDIVVSNATTITSIVVHSGSAGSGYKLYDSVTFNGSQFGSGSGSFTLAINALTGTNSYTSQSAPVVIINRLNDLRGVTKGILSIRNATNTSELAGITLSYGAPMTSLSQGLNFTIGGTNYMTLGASLSNVTFSRNVNIGSNTLTVNGATSLNGTTTFGTSMQQGGTNAVGSGAVGRFTNSSSISPQFQAAATSPVVGVLNTITLSVGGTGYSNGTVNSTGGTGTAATFTITTSGGVVQPTPTIVNRGSGYTTGDVLTLTGGANNATVTVTNVDFAGIIAGFQDNSSFVDAKSNYIYVSYYASPTYNITSTQVGSVYGWWYKGTHTNLGSFNQYSLVYENTGSKGGIGTNAPGAVWDIRGTTGIPTLRPVGFGTGTNYTIRAQQSDATTDIFTVKDNGDVQMGISSSKLGFYGSSGSILATGWTAPTGTLSRTGYATNTVTLAQIAQNLAALITDLKATNIIGT